MTEVSAINKIPSVPFHPGLFTRPSFLLFKRVWERATGQMTFPRGGVVLCPDPPQEGVIVDIGRNSWACGSDNESSNASTGSEVSLNEQQIVLGLCNCTTSHDKQQCL